LQYGIFLKECPFSDICDDDEEKATGWAEGSLAKQYKEVFGSMPYT
jgi:hypothetical protein